MYSDRNEPSHLRELRYPHPPLSSNSECCKPSPAKSLGIDGLQHSKPHRLWDDYVPIANTRQWLVAAVSFLTPLTEEPSSQLRVDLTLPLAFRLSLKFESVK